MTPDILPLDAFVRAMGAGRLTPHALFLGAGASISSGMPSAQMCIWEWKRSIFLTNNVGLEAQFSELSLGSVQTRIQEWLDRQGLYPKHGEASEYSVYIEACFPLPESRRLFFQDKVRHATPHVGYQLIGELAGQRIFSSVWTTNFDQLATRGLRDQTIAPIEVGIDSAHRAVRAPNSGELLIVSLHGDYRYDYLKNTATELQTQEAELELALVRELNRTPLVVCGYSGRDESLMRTLRQAYSQKGAGALYWCVHDAANVAGPVRQLIAHARDHGRAAYIVPTQGFDDLMVRLSLHCLDADGQGRATGIISRNASTSAPTRSAFRVEGNAPTAILKSNAFELETPSEVFAFEPVSWPQDGVWRWIREQTAGTQVVAVPFKSQVLALGNLDEIRACFAGNIKDRPQRSPLSPGSLRFDDGAVTALMRDALVRSIAKDAGVNSDGSRELWSTSAFRTETVHGEKFSVFDSVLLSIRQIDGRTYLIMKPSLRIQTQAGEEARREVANPIKLRILGYQHNKEFNDAVNGWREQLFGADSSQKVFEFPHNCGSPFRFHVRKVPLFAEIFGHKGMPGITVQPRFRPFLKQRGLEIAEPALLFSSKSGKATVRDPHPVRGIVANRPFDFPLTHHQLCPEIRLAVICPRQETRQLHSYLQGSLSQIAPGKQEADYLPLYPGFHNAYGVDLQVASPDSTGWVVCPEPGGADDRAKTLDIARSINRAVDTLQASHSPHVILIFYPARWSQYRGFSSDTERFDVHDFVKASCVQRGIGTQFLDQSTLSDSLQCRVWWWLSLAFYVKSLRTPWVLDGLDSNSAFVGLGISRDESRDRGKQIVMGCSHIYSARGEGLQYRVSQVENPVFFGRNPFLSRDDARRVGEQVRELFYESRSALPGRVVIHKRTRFTRDEQLGLREGLSGVPRVEMIEVIVDDTLRYIASSVDPKGALREDNYPVRRGSVVRLDDFSALVWVHGVTSAINSSRRYYQGKRRIPAPLLLRRHCGDSDLREIAAEILGLSKMNWNTFDLYTKLPATVQSSSEIARIGSLLQPFRTRAHDYRLFI